MARASCIAATDPRGRFDSTRALVRHPAHGADMLVGNGSNLAWDRSLQERVSGWRFETRPDTPYNGGGANSVDGRFLVTDGEQVCAILTQT